MDLYPIGAGALGLGVVVTFIISRYLLKPYRPIFFLMVAVPAIAATAYALMANGIGFIETRAGVVNSVRYADWLITTPILLYILSYAMVENVQARMRTFLTLAGLDVLMIVTGFLAELSTGTEKAILFGISTIAFLAMLYVIVETLLTLNEQRRSPTLKTLALGMAWVVLVLWSTYPFIWIFGMQGIGALGTTGEIIAYMALDITTKIGFAILLLIYLYIETNSQKSHEEIT